MIRRCSCGRTPTIRSSLFKEIHEALPDQQFKQYHFMLECRECGFRTGYKPTLDQVVNEWDAGKVYIEKRHRRVR